MLPDPSPDAREISESIYQPTLICFEPVHSSNSL
jgi:hypothetical protein